MKLRRVLLAVLVAISAVAVAPPLSAYAGGPTSVLMVRPNQQQARAAYNGDSVYAALTAGVGDSQSGSSDPPPGLGAGGDDVRLTWLVHDVHVWRIDRIHLTDGMWIETVVDHGGEGGMFDRPSFWHRAADPDGLLAALSAAGLLGDAGAAPSTAPSTAPVPEAEATVTAPATSFPALVVAGLSGLVLGVAGTVVAMRARRRTSSTERPARVTLSG